MLMKIVSSMAKRPDCNASLGSASSKHEMVRTAFMVSVYLVSSSLMTVLNNHVNKLSNHKFSLLCLQNGTTVVFIILARLLGLAKMEKLRIDFAVKWSPVSIAFVVMIWTSLEASRLVGIPAITAFRNATTCFVVLSDYFILKSRISLQCVFWLGFMFLSMIWFYQGAVEAVEKENTSSSSTSAFLRGILYLFINVAATVVNHIYAKKVMLKETSYEGVTIALYNNLLSLIALLPLAAYHEMFATRSSIASGSGYLYFLVALSSLLASVLAVSSYLVQKEVQVTSFSVASNSSKVLAILVNHYWPTHPEIWNIDKLIGLISTLFCAFMYALEKVAHNSKENQALARYLFPAYFFLIYALCINGALSYPF